MPKEEKDGWQLNISAGTETHHTNVNINTEETVVGERVADKTQVTPWREYLKLMEDGNTNPYRHKGLGITDLAEKYSETNDMNQTYTYLVDFLRENADDPIILQHTVNNLLAAASKQYDHTKKHGDVAGSQAEIFGKILDGYMQGQEVPNLICGTIHAFAMDALHDAGIDAAVVTGKMHGNEQHGALIYQQKDGKYVFCDYANSCVIDSPTVLDAVREVYKNSGDMQSHGYVQVFDNEKGVYTEYALSDVAAFGSEVDKRVINPENAATRATFVDQKTLNVNYKENGIDRSVTAEVILPMDSETRDQQLTVGAEYQQDGESNIFHESSSAGVKVGFDSSGESGVDYSGQVVASYTTGLSGNPLGADREAGSVTTYTVATRSSVSKDYTLVDNENLTLTSNNRATVIGSVSLTPTGDNAIYSDARGVVETGVSLTAGDFSAQASGGVVADLNMSYKLNVPSFGGKVNFGATYTHRTDSTAISIFGNGYGTFMPTSTEYGANLGVGLAGQTSSGTGYYLQTGLGYEHQDLSVGGFNQNTRNSLATSLEAGIKLKDGPTLFGGVSRTKDFVNPRRDDLNFNVGARFKF